VATWGVTAGCALLALGVLSCSGDDGSSAATTTTVVERSTTTSSSTTSTAPERPSSTTTTAYDPSVVEGQVEAAYLKSWDVYADAVYNLHLDEQALAEVFAEDAFELRRDEIKRRIADGRASHVRLEHRYEIVLTDAEEANVIDNFVNHQVLIDATTKSPVEPDPNEALLVNFRMKLIDGSWRVVFIQKVNP
jgi:hypothetical protein